MSDGVHEAALFSNFQTALEKVTVQSDSIVQLAKCILRVGSNPDLVQKYLAYWKEFANKISDPSKAKALIYILNEVIQQRFRAGCPNIISYTNLALLDVLRLFARKFPSNVPSCNRVISILEERRSCGDSDAIYEAFRKALWGIEDAEGIPTTTTDGAMSFVITDAQQDQSVDDNAGTCLPSAITCSEACSDDNISVDAVHEAFTYSMRIAVKACEKVIEEIELKKKTRRTLELQVKKGGSPDDTNKGEWTSTLMSAKRKQITRLLLKEWELRVQLQRHYKNILSILQNKLDCSLDQYDKIVTSQILVDYKAAYIPCNI